ncbi:MAG: class I SAM-dependent methyltransferase [Polyangiaceae bacterium]|nr:class I SAM-dependent methyltransferase [Polyangiaceae bacterium]
MSANSLVINLDSRPQRLEAFMKQPAAAALGVERCAAVHWKHVRVPARWRQLNQGPGGGYAALISHRSAIAEAQRRGWPHVLVFEDDAQVPNWFPGELARFMGHLPDDWDLVFFGGRHARHPWPDCFPEHVAGPVYRGSRTDQLECYMVRAKAFKAVIGALDAAIEIPRSWASFEFALLQRQLNFYVPFNLPISQPCGRGFSDQWNQEVDRKPTADPSLIDGWFSQAEGRAYLEQCMSVPGEPVVELGTWMGRSASWVIEWVNAHGGAFFAVDLWHEWERPAGRTPWQDFEWYMWKADLLRLINVIRADTAEAALQFEDQSVGLVMFDADHSREGLTRELVAWLPKVRKGGVLCGHDYNNPGHPGVTQAVDELLGKPTCHVDWFWAVHKA